MKSANPKIFFCAALISITVGTAIYILFRSTNLLVFIWIENVGLGEDVIELRDWANPILPHLPEFILYSLPDGLWAFSFSASILLIWRNEKSKKYLWLLVPIVFAILPEILQKFKLFPGTFDVYDLIMSLTGIGLSLLLTQFKNKNNEKSTA
jgi:hypothetical protein